MSPRASRQTRGQEIHPLNRSRQISSELLFEFIRDYQSKQSMSVVRNAGPTLPIVWFGDSQAYFTSERRIVTIGLNPSLKEFSDKRFDSTIDWSGKDVSLRLSETLNQYFNYNPYWSWFHHFETVLELLHASYRVGSFRDRAVHIDVFSSIATNPTWGKLSESIRNRLQRTDLFKRLLAELNPDVILYSANEAVRNTLFPDFELIDEAQYTKNNDSQVRGVHVRLYRHGNVRLLTGRNMHGTPFGGMSQKWLRKTIPSLRW